MGLWVIAVIGGAFIVVWHRNNYKEAREDRATATRDRADLKADVCAVKENVQNGHPEPLRNDLDRVMHKQESIDTKLAEVCQMLSEWAPLIPIVRSMPEELRILRHDIEDANAARRSLAADVRDDMTEIRKRWNA
jgi:hypothetical protein